MMLLVHLMLLLLLLMWLLLMLLMDMLRWGVSLLRQLLMLLLLLLQWLLWLLLLGCGGADHFSRLTRGGLFLLEVLEATRTSDSGCERDQMLGPWFFD
jgi:hypothetical protein